MKPENVYLTQEDKDILKEYKTFLKYGNYDKIMDDLVNHQSTLKKLAVSIYNPQYIGFIQLLISLDIDFYSNATIIPKCIFKNCRFSDKNIVLNNCTDIRAFSFHGAFLDSLKAPKCVHVNESSFLKSTLKQIELPRLREVDHQTFNNMSDLEYLDLRNLDSLKCFSSTFMGSAEIKTLVIGENTKLLKGNFDDALMSDEEVSNIYGLKIIRI